MLCRAILRRTTSLLVRRGLNVNRRSKGELSVALVAIAFAYESASTWGGWHHDEAKTTHIRPGKCHQMS